MLRYALAWCNALTLTVIVTLLIFPNGNLIDMECKTNERKVCKSSLATSVVALELRLEQQATVTADVSEMLSCCMLFLLSIAFSVAFYSFAFYCCFVLQRTCLLVIVFFILLLTFVFIWFLS